MLKTVRIKNFRGFDYFELQNLGRINLLVGKNNSGKTSVLEAIQLLTSGTNIEPLTEIMLNRGEFVWNDEDSPQREIEICHLFRDRNLKDRNIVISGQKQIIQDNHQQIVDLELTASIHDQSIYPHQYGEIPPYNQQIPAIPRKLLSIDFSCDREKVNQGYILSDQYNLPFKKIYSTSEQSKVVFNNQFILPNSLTIDRMIDLFNQVVLNPEEVILNEALQIIEPKIERIAAVIDKRNGIIPSGRGGFVVRLADSEQRISIGSLGDGIWRMLGLALSLASAKGGVLLVDEIDTGLHFTALTDMWKLIWETAKKLDVQVFAVLPDLRC
ncbi:MAG: AAA family ATPase [Jaaginema sp. PMC 1080.18]|nr:AAA family ATPase [Jaaginema sp. PMC 1080.18]